MLKQIVNRFPALNQIIPVYAVIVFMSFAWAILVFLWKLTSWLYFQAPYEILAILAYVVMQIFFDTLVYLGVLLAVCAILPSRWLRDDFNVRGAWIAFSVIGSMIAYLNLFFFIKISSPLWILLTLLALVAAIMLSNRFKRMANIALQVSDRLIIFLYIVLPASAVSIITVIIRNIK